MSDKQAKTLLSALIVLSVNLIIALAVKLILLLLTSPNFGAQNLETNLLDFISDLLLISWIIVLIAYLVKTREKAKQP